MTPQEKALYHQIHPLKLVTDISVDESLNEEEVAWRGRV